MLGKHTAFLFHVDKVFRGDLHTFNQIRGMSEKDLHYQVEDLQTIVKRRFVLIFGPSIDGVKIQFTKVVGSLNLA